MTGRDGRPPEPSGDPREAALAWFVRLESGDADAADRAAFADWLARDPAHRQEFDRLSGVWSDLGSLPDPRMPTPRLPDPRRAVRPQPTRRRLLAFAMGGAAACAAGLGGTVVLTGWPGEIRTGTGERRSLALADGSSVELDAGSALAVEFSAAERRVRLIDGRARFVAAADPGRPFAVACADGSVTMVDATVTVHRRPDDVVVAVEKGTATLAAGNRPPVHLAAGHCRSYGPDGPGPLLRDGLAAETAWRQGRLVFQAQPLDAVVADLNRYHPARILLWDSPLAALLVDGSVDIARPDAALNAIVRTLPVRTMRPFPGLVIIRSV
ncbi:DUF4880 domain-containing protein [Azospirillum melinis]|uniref:DUF4880 domain-containing protein n=1 Tax=Azospirillum melinis TaxID=328839 RepID=A0ABX2KLP8_9PROT|nr:transmembrane sensor [Azospirillum melinis]NUB02723.1 DUF4880 domain-containing protein [Azospirillum melinis]